MTVQTEFAAVPDVKSGEMIETPEFYLPLPDGLTIKESPIHGLGLYAVKHFLANTRLGITHIADDRFPDGYIRTPLGGFYNHEADSPNCRVEDEGDFRVLYTSEEIESGTEITVRYRLYDPS